MAVGNVAAELPCLLLMEDMSLGAHHVTYYLGYGAQGEYPDQSLESASSFECQLATRTKFFCQNSVYLCHANQQQLCKPTAYWSSLDAGSEAECI